MIMLDMVTSRITIEFVFPISKNLRGRVSVKKKCCCVDFANIPLPTYANAVFDTPLFATKPSYSRGNISKCDNLENNLIYKDQHYNQHIRIWNQLYSLLFS